MKNKLKRTIAILTVSAMPLVYISGCDKIDLETDDENKIIEYAVNAVINHDKNYIIKLVDREPEPETTTVWISDNPEQNTTAPDKEGNTGGSGNGGNGSGGTQNNVVSVNEAFGISGFTVTSTGYQVLEKYPDNNDSFSMVAVPGNRLLILKFNVTNTSSGQAVLDMTELNYSYRCLINDDTRVNAQRTMLLDALNTWNKALDGGETKEMVLVFQVSEEVSDNINNIGLYIAKDGQTSVTAIK